MRSVRSETSIRLARSIFALSTMSFSSVQSLDQPGSPPWGTLSMLVPSRLACGSRPGPQLIHPHLHSHLCSSGETSRTHRKPVLPSRASGWNKGMEPGAPAAARMTPQT